VEYVLKINARENRRGGESRTDNAEKQTTPCTQDTGQRQTKHNTTQKTKIMSKMDPTVCSLTTEL